MRPRACTVRARRAPTSSASASGVKSLELRGMRPALFLKESLRSMRRNAVPSFAALASVLVTVLVLGVFIPIVQATTGAANDVRNRVLVNLYLKPDAKPADVDRVRSLLGSGRVAYVGKVEYVSKAAAL